MNRITITPLGKGEPAMLKARQIDAVKQHARDNYGKGGWDEVVEAWSVQDILDAIGDARTVKGAICKVAAIVRARHAYAEDIRATAF